MPNISITIHGHYLSLITLHACQIRPNHIMCKVFTPHYLGLKSGTVYIITVIVEAPQSFPWLRASPCLNPALVVITSICRVERCWGVRAHCIFVPDWGPQYSVLSWFMKWNTLPSPKIIILIQSYIYYAEHVLLKIIYIHNGIIQKKIIYFSSAIYSMYMFI